MLCCAASVPVMSPKHPGFSDFLSVLVVSKHKPHVSELLPLAREGQSIRVYHVSSLAEFINAYIGSIFKAYTLPDNLKLKHLPRAFHAIIITDWPESARKAERCIIEIQRAKAGMSWQQPPILITTKASDSLSASAKGSLIQEDEWQANLIGQLTSFRIPPKSYEPHPDRPPIKVAWDSPQISPSSVTSASSAAATLSLTTPGILISALESTPHVPTGLRLDTRGDFTTTITHPFAVTSYPAFSVAPTDPAKELLSDLLSLAHGAAERASISIHQNALLEAFSMERLLSRGLSEKNARHFRLALAYSDMGKISYYKDWYKVPSEDGSALFNALQLKGESPLAKLLSELSASKPYLNPTLTHDQLRSIFNAVPALVAYFHEFQGMRFAEKRLLEGHIDIEEFREIVLGFYGHNGPGDPRFEIAGEKPFWASLPSMITSRLESLVTAGTLEEVSRTLFEGTQFVQADGALKYHDPKTALGAEHSFYDRFDGYRDSTKIREELSFLPPIAAEVESLLGPNYNTRLAMIYNETILLPRMLESNLITRSEHSRLTRVCQILRERVEFIHGQIVRRIENSAQLLNSLHKKEPLESITIQFKAASTIESRTFKREDLGDWSSEAAIAFRAFVDLHIRKAVSELDEETYGIYNDGFSA